MMLKGTACPLFDGIAGGLLNKALRIVLLADIWKKGGANYLQDFPPKKRDS